VNLNIQEPNSSGAATPNAPARAAVAIPCFNEAAAIETVLRQWRVALPDAEIVVFDNNSTDGTGDLARAMGVRVIPVPDQGKGFAVQAVFRELGDRDAVILTDGDGTYPADAAPRLLKPVLEDKADMTVGARRAVEASGAMAPVRGLGNFLIRSAFFVLLGRGGGDLLSGYRVFGPKSLRTVTLHATGFEIEAEIMCQAIARGLRVVDVPVDYHPRIAGTVSKLRAFRDGRRILATIVTQSARRNPFWTWIVLCLPVVLLTILLERYWPPRDLAVGAATLLALALIVILRARAGR
jgi:glycosyltransferase involved in cell wall biosynthesis